MKRSTLAEAFRPAVLVPAVTAGLVIGVLELFTQISYATLIFRGDLTPFLARGIGLALFSSFVLALVVALTSSFPTTIAMPQDSPAAILALVAAAISAALVASGDTHATFGTVIAAITLTALLMGAFFFGLGVLRLGRFVRYIPLPVIGGFLAGTGWLLIQGGIAVMTGAQLSAETIAALTQPAALLRWVPGVVLAVLVILTLRRWAHPLVIPSIVLAAVVVFYIAVGASGSSVEQAREGGWMLGPFPSGALFQFSTITAVMDANWGLLLSQVDKIATILLITVIGFLLNAGAIELVSHRDVDLNRELKAVGLANMLTSIGAGLPGFTLLDATTLSWRLGARSRLTGITVAIVFVFALLVGASALAYFPRPVVGALLVFSGLTFLEEWLYNAFFKLSRLDYALILLIVGAIVFIGFLPGIGVGIAVAMVLFIFNYSRIQVIKHELTGASYRSAVERSPSQREQLREHGAELLILQLQEFIFFGTAQHLLDRVRERITNLKEMPLRFLVLDFERVSGVDASAISGLMRLVQLTRAQTIETLVTNVPPAMRLQLERGGLGHMAYFDTLDAAVEQCENLILAQNPSPLDAISWSLQAQLVAYMPHAEQRARLQHYLERIELAADTVLVQQGEVADALYFIEQGVLSVDISLHNGRSVRMRRIQSGTVVGEIGVYLGDMRTATVTTVEPTIAFRVSKVALDEMERRDPDLAAALHKWVATIMAERLADDVRVLEAVMH